MSLPFMRSGISLREFGARSADGVAILLRGIARVAAALTLVPPPCQGGPEIGGGAVLVRRHRVREAHRESERVRARQEVTHAEPCRGVGGRGSPVHRGPGRRGPGGAEARDLLVVDDWRRGGR